MLWNTASHNRGEIERLRQVRWLLACIIARHYLADAVDDLSATEQLRPRERELLVWT